jgi:hypothetical protein
MTVYCHGRDHVRTVFYYDRRACYHHCLHKIAGPGDDEEVDSCSDLADHQIYQVLAVADETLRKEIVLGDGYCTDAFDLGLLRTLRPVQP